VTKYFLFFKNYFPPNIFSFQECEGWSSWVKNPITAQAKIQLKNKNLNINMKPNNEENVELMLNKIKKKKSDRKKKVSLNEIENGKQIF
jgi:hypothetical protein